MNERTLVSACCYAGDSHLVQSFMPAHESHQCPIVILSPLDSPVVNAGGHICRQTGLRAYIGQESLDRQTLYHEILLSYDFDWYFICDADSFCLSAKFPRELYADTGLLWSNEVTEPRPHETPGRPKLAFQPPYWLSRSALVRMIEAARGLRAHPVTPYVDWYMMEVCYRAGLGHRAFRTLETEHGTPRYLGTDPWETLYDRVRCHNACFMHPIKTRIHFETLRQCRAQYEAEYLR